jgi:hypothetical protein
VTWLWLLGLSSSNVKWHYGHNDSHAQRWAYSLHCSASPLSNERQRSWHFPFRTKITLHWFSMRSNIFAYQLSSCSVFFSESNFQNPRSRLIPRKKGSYLPKKRRHPWNFMEQLWRHIPLWYVRGYDEHVSMTSFHSSSVGLHASCPCASSQFSTSLHWYVSDCSIKLVTAILDTTPCQRSRWCAKLIFVYFIELLCGLSLYAQCSSLILFLKQMRIQSKACIRCSVCRNAEGVVAAQ